MEGFRIDLKTFLGLAMPNQYSNCQKVNGFGIIVWGQNPLIFIIPIYSTTVLYCMIKASQTYCMNTAKLFMPRCGALASLAAYQEATLF